MFSVYFSCRSVFESQGQKTPRGLFFVFEVFIFVAKNKNPQSQGTFCFFAILFLHKLEETQTKKMIVTYYFLVVENLFILVFLVFLFVTQIGSYVL